MPRIRLSSHQSEGPVIPVSRSGGTSRPEYFYVDGPDIGGTNGLATQDQMQYWRILKRRKGTLLATALLCAATGFLLTFWMSPAYRARTFLEMENLNEDFLNIRNLSPTASGGGSQAPDSNIRTQIMILQSRPVLERAIEKTNLERRLLATNQRPGAFAWNKNRNTYGPEPALNRERALALVEPALKVRTELNTRIVEVTFDSTDPQVAADFANALSAAFAEATIEKRWEAAEKTSEWLTRQLQDVRTKLANAEDAVRTYTRASNLIFLSDKDNVAEDRLRQLQLELSKAQAERAARQSVYELTSVTPQEALPQVLDDSTLKDYQVQLTALRRQLGELASSLALGHPKMVKTEAAITAVQSAFDKKRSNIISRIRHEYQSAARREKLLLAEYDAQVGLVGTQADKITQYSILKREVDSTRQLYDGLFQKVKEARLASGMRTPEMHVIESAVPPKTPIRPNSLLNTAFGLLSGIGAAALFVIARARSDRGIQEPGDTPFHLNVPELGAIPACGEKFSHGRRGLGKSGLDSISQILPPRVELTTWHHRRSALAESFHLTLASILLLEKMNGVGPRILAFSSANPGEGKTTVISNLAIALAQVSRRVLLIDGDMRNPRLHELFGIENDVGLGEALVDISKVAIRETAIPNLSLLPSGSSGDEGLLFTRQATELLEQLKKNFDMILIDTPPLLQMSGARMLGHNSDALILVVAQHTTRDAILLAQQRLNEDGTWLLGTILNNWNPRKSMYGYRKYGDYYGAPLRKDDLSKRWRISHSPVV
jgi:succinoglycan biosynthesis transport protein ExoP